MLCCEGTNNVVYCFLQAKFHEHVSLFIEEKNSDRTKKGPYLLCCMCCIVLCWVSNLGPSDSLHSTTIMGGLLVAHSYIIPPSAFSFFSCLAKRIVKCSILLTSLCSYDSRLKF